MNEIDRRRLYAIEIINGERAVPASFRAHQAPRKQVEDTMDKIQRLSSVRPGLVEVYRVPPGFQFRGMRALGRGQVEVLVSAVVSEDQLHRTAPADAEECPRQ